jgi:hypothetical protein
LQGRSRLSDLQAAIRIFRLTAWSSAGTAIRLPQLLRQQCASNLSFSHGRLRTAAFHCGECVPATVICQSGRDSFKIAAAVIDQVLVPYQDETRF